MLPRNRRAIAQNVYVQKGQGEIKAKSDKKKSTQKNE